MSSIKIVISDLHLAGGHSVLDGFGDTQQAGLEGLLTSTRGRDKSAPYGSQEDDVELILNGDIFDFLAVPPYETHGTIDALTATDKMDKIIAAHSLFFALLRSFVEIPGHTVTFLLGNHDIDLRFEEVRRRIVQAIDAKSGVNFCVSRYYRPLPDVYIEHGNQYDFWNAARVWNEKDEIQPGVNKIMLPIGSHYLQHAGQHITLHYPFFDHFEPSMNTSSQIALLCLLNPDLVVETAQRLMDLLTYPRKALADLAPGEECIPTKLFEQAMIDFAAYQQDMMTHCHDWVDPMEQDASEAQNDALLEFMQLRDALTLPLQEAIAAICEPRVYAMAEYVAAGMYSALRNDPTLRYAIAGHTHMPRIDTLSNGTQVYLNTATWTTRLALPTPEEITPELIAWLRQPNWNEIPLQDATQLTFVLTKGEHDEINTHHFPSSASLCFWEGGTQGTHRVLV